MHYYCAVYHVHLHDLDLKTLELPENLITVSTSRISKQKSNMYEEYMSQWLMETMCLRMFSRMSPAFMPLGCTVRRFKP
jgi:hypothetical protein